MTTIVNTDKHPEIQKVLPKWKRSRILLDEIEKDYTDADLFLRLPNEEEQEYAARAASYRLGFVNEAGKLVRAKGAAVYKRGVRRDGLSDAQEAFAAKADQSGQSFEEMMQAEVAPVLAAYGTVFAVLDKPPVPAVNRAEELKSALPYLTVLDPFQVIDFEWTQDGSLNWFQYAVKRAAPRDPMKPQTRTLDSDYDEVVTWTRDEYITKKGRKPVERKPNPFGFVPVVIQAQYVEANKTIGKTSFFSTSRYIFAGNNLLHASNYETFKQVSAILAMQLQDFTDEEAIKPRDAETGERRIEQSSKEQKRIIPFQSEKPSYIERQPELIELAATRANAYFDLAAENEKSAMSVSSAQVAESGIAKSYNFMDVNWVLSEFAAVLERFEEQVFEQVGRMTGGAEGWSVAYPREFDIRDFNARIQLIKDLQTVSFPSELAIRESYKAVTPEITNNEVLQADINREIDKAPINPDNPNNSGEPDNQNQGE